MRNIATMRAISKAQLRDFFSIGSIVLAEISQSFLFLVPFLHYITITLVNQSKKC